MGLFGYLAEGNATVVMEEAAFQALGLNFRYVTCLVHPDDLLEAVSTLTALNLDSSS